MGDVILILVSMFAVFGVYMAMHELRSVLLRLARRLSKKIDKPEKEEYNNTESS